MVDGANSPIKCLFAQCTVFKALDLKIKFLGGSLVFVNPENSIGFGAVIVSLRPRFFSEALIS